MKKKIIYVAVTSLIVIIALVILGTKIYSNYREEHTPSDVVMDLNAYYNVPSAESMIILDGDVYEKNAYFSSGTAYLDADTVKKMYTHRFFYVEEENNVFYSTPSEIYMFTPGSKDFVLNGETYTSSVPCVEKRDGQIYIAVDFLETCGITYSIYHNPERLLITFSDEDYLCADCEKTTQIRVSQSIKADILGQVEVGDILRIIDGGGIRENGFIKVMSRDGIRGYILESDISDTYYRSPVFREYIPEEYSHNRINEPVYLGWQLLYTKNNLDHLANAIKLAPEMNVIAPTWFFLSDTDGQMISYATQDYVDKAHELGLKVWATYKNDTIEGQFTCTEDSHRLLSSTSSRNNLIDNILASVEEYGLDGINIDFEMLKLDSGVFFIQFLRELSVKCRERGIILSVDNYVPANYNAYYDLKEQSFLVDYIVIMGYDEHYSGSEKAGSVASLNWFKDAIDNTIAKTGSPDGVIMGIPFYTRLWKEEGNSLSVEATLGMKEAQKKVSSTNAEKVWKEEAGQYYAEYKSSGARFRIWLEDEESITCKVGAVHDAALSGVAAWKLGDETEGTWALIKDVFENGILEPEPDEAEIEE